MQIAKQPFFLKKKLKDWKLKSKEETKNAKKKLL